MIQIRFIIGLLPFSDVEEKEEEWSTTAGCGRSIFRFCPFVHVLHVALCASVSYLCLFLCTPYGVCRYSL